jgi:hypothetical protein
MTEFGERAHYRFVFRFDFFAVFFFEAFRSFDAFFGTFLPLALASDSPIAIACLRLLTFLPERPLFSVPALRFFIARLTSVDAFFEYLRAIAFSGFPRFGKKLITGGMQSSSHVIVRLHWPATEGILAAGGRWKRWQQRTAPPPDRGGFNDIDEVARRGPNHACGTGDDVRRSLAPGG